MGNWYGTAFVIDDVAYVCCGQNNNTLVDDLWKFDGDNWLSCVTLPILIAMKIMMMIML